ncbi:Rne/Rng family ribonuclease [Fodinicurvata sp. EGI_FJ10296]|uniref:Rne/Rng family ribonuclease n=1 Tax=Fodinicurvata sp. EGI_FJ10296 TaxID=3231908 RepID=UPI0034544164
MTKRMLIDASHPEETRVVVLDGNKLDEFDFETSSKKQLKGNIYLAKVTRVEPSLQSAFVEYGGNRHGFLAFSEIHPDYYRIPVADREALIEEESKAAAEAGKAARQAAAQGNAIDQDDPFGDPRDEDDGRRGSRSAQKSQQNGGDNDDDDEDIETVGGDDIDEAAQTGPVRPKRSYKIQEVIKRRQILLVQVTKEERGNKGAALTTYLSLAGRYCVLMPNTPRGGGISRKIVSPKDRKRLKSILDDLMIPEGMAVILRTAGLERTKAEIKRDLDYLLRLWDNIRETTLQSTAPTLIYEEANLIKRAERDLYTKDIDDIQVAGEEGYRTAKDFMKMLMPSHARRVKPYRDGHIPLFQRYAVESQIDAMHSPTVALKSGGYVVINPTEALVAIDVNSGRSTRERNIEETAYKTNLEAADEIARQLRLRDLAGLIVIDFIDMEDDRHNAAVERRLKEAMRQDRARIQLGRISAFGLLELSRQRLRPSLTETHFEPCPRCNGTGLTRSLSSSALHLLRAIEEEGIRSRSAVVRVSAATDVVLFVLNDKRAALTEIEQRYAFSVILARDDTLIPPEHRIDQVQARSAEEIAAAEARAAAAAAEQRLIEKQAAQADEELVDEELDGEDIVPVGASAPAPILAPDAAEESDDTESARPSDGQNGDESGAEGRSKRKRRSRSRRRRRDDRPEENTEERQEERAEDATSGPTADDIAAAPVQAPIPHPTEPPRPAQEARMGADAVDTRAPAADRKDDDKPVGGERQRPPGGWWARRRAAAEAAASTSVARDDVPTATPAESYRAEEHRSDISTLDDAENVLPVDENADDDEIGEVFPSSSGAYEDETEEERQRRRRRRGKRGGRRRSGRRRDEDGVEEEDDDVAASAEFASGDRDADLHDGDGVTAAEIPVEPLKPASEETETLQRQDRTPEPSEPQVDEAAAESASGSPESATAISGAVTEPAEGSSDTAPADLQTGTQPEEAPAKPKAKPRAPRKRAAAKTPEEKTGETKTGETTARKSRSRKAATTTDTEAPAEPKRSRAPRKSTKAAAASGSGDDAGASDGPASAASAAEADGQEKATKAPAKKATTRSKSGTASAKATGKTASTGTTKRAAASKKTGSTATKDDDAGEPKPSAAKAPGRSRSRAGKAANADTPAASDGEAKSEAAQSGSGQSESGQGHSDRGHSDQGDAKKPRRGWWAARG